MSRNIQVKDADGSIVTYANLDCPPPARAGYTIHLDVPDFVPPPAGDTTSVERWQGGAAVWVQPTLTPQQVFNAAVAAGYTVPGVTPALVLAMDDKARNLFHQLSYQLMTMKDAGRLTDDAQMPITDLNGVTRMFSVANVQTMIMGLGETYLGLYGTLHAVTPPAAPAVSAVSAAAAVQ